MSLRVKKDRMKKPTTKNLDLFGGSSKSSPLNDDDGQIHCAVPLTSCIRRGDYVPKSVSEGGVKMRCTNDKCQYASQLIHIECFEELENTLLKIIKNLGSARGWTDIQRRHNLWEKKGLTLVQKRLRCHCGLGLMVRDADFYKKLEAATNNTIDKANNGSLTSINGLLSINGGGNSADLRNKKKKKKELPRLNFGYNNVMPPNENADMYKKKFNELDTYFLSSHRDDSNDDASSSEFSYSVTANCQKNSFIENSTPRVIKVSSTTSSAWKPNNGHSVSTTTSSAWKSNKGQSVSTTALTTTAPAWKPPVYKTNSAWKTNNAHSDSSEKKVPKENSTSSTWTSGPSSITPNASVFSTPAQTKPQIMPLSNSQKEKTSWRTLPNALSSPIANETQLRPQQQQKRSEYYTLFGENSFSFLLGERFLADVHLPL